MKMTRHAILPLLFCLSVFSPAHAALPCDALSWGARDPVRAFAVNGDELWISGDTSLELWRIGASAAPEQVLRRATAGRAMEAFGDGIAMLDGSDLSVHDRHGERARAESDHTALAVHGNRIITAGSDLALWALEGATLRLLDEMPLPTRAQAGKVAFDGSLVAAATRSHGIVFARVSGDQLVSAGSVGVSARDLTFAGETIWAAAGATGLVPISATTLTTVAGGAIDSNRGNFVGIERAGNHLIVADDNGSLRLYRADGMQAQLVSVTEQAYDAVSADGNSIAARRLRRSRFGEPIPSRDRLELFRLDDELHPAGVIAGDGAPLEGAAVRGNIIYITDPPYLRVLRHSGRALEEIGSVHYGDASDRIKISGDLAVVYGRGDAHLISIGDPARPQYEGVFRGLGTSPNEVAFAGPWLLETNRGSGFHILDITDRTNPIQVGGMINDGYGQFTLIAGTPGTAYGVADQGVKVIDIRDIPAVANPWTSRYERVLPHGRTTAVETVLEGPVGILVVADAETLHIYSLEDELDPMLRSTLQTGNVRSLGRVEGEQAILATLADGGVLHVDLTAPSQPRIETTYDYAAVQAHGDGQSIVAATSQSLILIPRHDTPGPVLEARTLSDGRILLTWRGSLPWQLAASPSASFDGAVQTSRATASIIIDAEHAGMYVRGVDECGRVSDVVHVDARSADLVAGRSMIRLSGPAGETVTTSFTIWNHGGSDQQLSISAPEGVSVTASDATIPAGSSSTITLTATIPQVTLESALDLGALEIPLRLEPYTVVNSNATIPADSLLIPGVGLTPGARDTMWRSRVDLLCASDVACNVQLTWIGPGPARSMPLRLEAGEGMIIDDAGHALGVTGSGAVAIHGERIDRVDAGATTFNDSASGFYGQRIEAMDLASSTRVRRWFVPALTADENFRTNIGMATAGGPQNAVVTLLDGSGAVITTLHVTVEARSALSLPVPIDSGARSAIVEATDLVVWGSRIDQQTGDATYIRALPRVMAGEDLIPAAQSMRLDQAGRTTGVAGSRWETDIVIANPHDTAVEVETRWFPLDGGPQRSTMLSIAPGESLLDLADRLLVEGGLGSITMSATAPIAVWARAYLASAPEGTFGQLLPTGGDSGDLTVRRSALFPLSESPDFRSNLYLAETDGEHATAVIEVREIGGRTLTAHVISLSPWESVSIGSFLREWGLNGAEHVQLWLHPDPGSSIRAVASVVANATGDGVSLALEPEQ